MEKIPDTKSIYSLLHFNKITEKTNLCLANMKHVSICKDVQLAVCLIKNEHIVIIVVLTWVYTFVKMNRTVHLKEMYCTIYQSYIHKVDSNFKKCYQ